MDAHLVEIANANANAIFCGVEVQEEGRSGYHWLGGKMQDTILVKSI